MFLALSLLLILTIVAGVFMFGLFGVPTFASANILFYFLLALFLVTLIVAFTQQVIHTPTKMPGTRTMAQSMVR
jgi:uncharacterized membrane protein YtjA (UPF0391 family)